ncbi:LysR family transcriptional regulator [Alicyclobacillus fastidiosus]|uniref:LysR family transcriptional regulator n=1 Tax=Alicyclobacillus fastidiosus TaxID=392011 RepID=A0ABY6ZJT2_9BACL|nr:LysR family transcriptional regulator [Alicyclobacillus fastidiosus]WAH43172.1 LysR family transcriptional regulator [Alicyclobacillus fastidiosus]GMA65191.1 LysR family transcriptional regulator [Alicyclobacillus fastidiosus]
MELKNIEAFLMVVQKGSFSAAADALFISQPTISVRIQQMEQQLKTPLFQRENGKRIVLTDTGKKVYPYFEEAFHLIQQAMDVLQETPVSLERVQISCPNHMGVEIMPEVFKVLYHQFPNCEFLLKVSVNEQLIEDIQHGAVDLGFTYLRPSEPHENLSVIRVANEQNILVCAPDHPLARMSEVSFADLERERIIVYNHESFTTKIITHYIEKHHLNMYQQVEISNVGWLKMMVRKGLGVAFLQKIIVQEELENGKLVQVDLGRSLPPTPIYLLVRSSVNERIKETIIRTAKRAFSKL